MRAQQECGGEAKAETRTLKKRLRVLQTLLGPVLLIALVRILVRSWELTALVIGSLVLHEFGHMAALRWFGVRSRLTFHPLGGGVSPEKGERFEALQHFEHGVVSFAGLAVNMGLLLVGLLFDAISSNLIWIRLAWTVSILTAWNALPFGIFDGGKLLRSIFASLTEKEAWRVAGGITMAATLLGGGMLLYDAEKALGYFYFPLLICWGIMRQAGGRNDPTEITFLLQAMSKQQAVWFILLYAIVLFASYIAMVFLEI